MGRGRRDEMREGNQSHVGHFMEGGAPVPRKLIRRPAGTESRSAIVEPPRGRTRERSSSSDEDRETSRKNMGRDRDRGAPRERPSSRERSPIRAPSPVAAPPIVGVAKRPCSCGKRSPSRRWWRGRCSISFSFA